MKKFILVTGIALALMACNDVTTPTADQQTTAKQEQIEQEGNAQVGIPTITKFTEKKGLKRVYEASDNADLICYAYTFSEVTGKFSYLGKCLGYGIPYSTQFSNPQKVVADGQGANYAFGTLPQAEPNGLFKPTSSDATWLFLIGADGKTHLVYMEPKITVSDFPLPNVDTTK